MDNENEKLAILEAIADGKYEVEYEPVDSIFEYTKYDGTKFYVIEDLDDARSSTDMGSITFGVETDAESYEFIYDMNCGEWEGDEFCDDEDVQVALEELDEFIDYEDYDGDAQWEIYANEYAIPVDAPHYWCEDDDCPKDVESLDAYDVYVPLQYFIQMSHGVGSEFMDMECTMTCGDLFDLYKLLKEKGYWDEDGVDNDEEIELPGQEFEKEYLDLYNDIMEQVEDEAAESGYENENDYLKFILILSKDFIEENL